MIAPAARPHPAAEQGGSAYFAMRTQRIPPQLDVHFDVDSDASPGLGSAVYLIENGSKPG